MDNLFDNKEIQEIPYLIQLLDDPTPKVRQTVINKLLAFGIHLDTLLNDQGIILSAEQKQVLNTCLNPLLKEKNYPQKEEALFKAGDLVEHKRYNYRGLVVDYDSSCKAAENWYKNNRTQPDKGQNWYHVLVHNSGSVTYAAESSLKPAKCVDPIVHPLLPFFFDGFNGSSYLRNHRPWGSF